MAEKLGKIKKVPLRELWSNEANDFTTWLEKNIDYLNEQIGLQINITDREKRVGDFFVDLVGENESGVVVIENQLEKTDHDHFGKIITYLAMTDAKTAVWITSNPREEHLKGVEWLNEAAPSYYSFYLIKVEAVRIGNSPPAPIFSVVEGPSRTVKEARKTQRELADRHYLRKEFWTGLLERARDKTDLFNNISPRFDHWMGIGGGKAGIAFNFTILNDQGACEIYFDRGKGFEELNKERFDSIYKHKGEIEKKITSKKIEWERLDSKRASRIKIVSKGTGLKSKDNWEKLQDDMVDTMIKMKEVFSPYINELK